jgi:hypothetical protein
MDRPKIITDPTIPANMIYFMPDRVIEQLADLALAKFWGRISNEQFERRMDGIVEEYKRHIGVVRNIGG